MSANTVHNNHNTNSTGGVNSRTPQPTAITSAASVIPTAILDDLSTRFVINIPREDRSDLIRVCFQLELAHWHYLDLIRGQDSRLPSVNFTRFSAIIFRHIPFLQPFIVRLDAIIAEWKSYKLLVPTCGAIMLDPLLEHVLLVQGFGGRSWGFPKGKLNEDEPYHKCAVREVYEETSYDCAASIDHQSYIEREYSNEKTVRLYIVKGVPKDFPFAPLCRNEIKDIKWFSVAELPVRTPLQMDGTNGVTVTLGGGAGTPGAVKANQFYNVLPFIKPLRRFIAKERRQLVLNNQRDRRDSEAAKDGGGHESLQTDLFWAKSWDNIKFDWDNIWREIYRESSGATAAAQG